MSDRPAPAGSTPPWRAQGPWFRALLGGPARKVPLDAGLSCPNRDGALSFAGCSFCNPAGSGTGLAARGLSLAEQWARLAPRAAAGRPGVRLLAYLQAYSNTHCAPARLRELLAQIAALPGVAGLCLGTRPDCLDAEGVCDKPDAEGGDTPRQVAGGCERLDILAACGLPFVQLDLGLQSADDAVLAACNRGHDAASFARAARAAAARGLLVCAHLVHGLPGAGPDDLERSVAFLNALPVAAVKFHNLLVCRGAGLEAEWRAGRLALATRAEYVAALAQALARLRPDVCVQRLFADPAPGELLAPDWALDKAAGLELLRREMAGRGLFQGCMPDT